MRPPAHICHIDYPGETYSAEEQAAMYPHWCCTCLVSFESTERLAQHQRRVNAYCPPPAPLETMQRFHAMERRGELQ